VSLQGAWVEGLSEGRKSKAGLDEQNTALNGAFSGEEVREMGPTTFPAGDSVDLNATSEYIFIDNALRVNVICDGFAIRAVPDTELGNIQT